MSALGYLVAAVFLPLFPLSMLLNRLLVRLRSPWLRMGLLLVWPQVGVLALSMLGDTPPAWMLWWAVATAALYALRALPLRDLGLWIGYMATSAWALLWPFAVFAPASEGGSALVLQAAGLSVPFVLLAWMAGRLESLLGAAYAGTGGGLAETMPRLAGLLVPGVLAAVATPLVPGFFALLSTTIRALAPMPGVALAILTVWLMWAWGGARIIRGFVAGPAGAAPRQDLGVGATGLVALAFVILVLTGIGYSGEMI
jgi:NADH:ubiquinone oxidoreductase subunit 4 (subunit M)